MDINILEAEGILKYYGVRELLLDCYVRCSTGDIIGILGRNGSGKSTLLKIIFGIESAINKTIRINGKHVKQPYESGLLSYMPQFPFIPGNQRISKLINIYSINKQAKEMITEKIRNHGILDKKSNDLSGGQLKYFELMLLIHLDSKFILLDEPFANIEPIFKEQIIAEIKHFSSTKGFIVTDHDYESIIKVSTSISLLTNGFLKSRVEFEDLSFLSYLPENVPADIQRYWPKK